MGLFVRQRKADGQILPLNVREENDVFPDFVSGVHCFWFENLAHVFSIQVHILVLRNNMLIMRSYIAGAFPVSN